MSMDFASVGPFVSLNVILTPGRYLACLVPVVTLPIPAMEYVAMCWSAFLAFSGDPYETFASVRRTIYIAPKHRIVLHRSSSINLDSTGDGSRQF